MKCPFKRNIIEGENYTGNKATKVTFGDCEKDCMAYVGPTEYETFNGKETTPEYCMLCYHPYAIRYYGGVTNGD